MRPLLEVLRHPVSSQPLSEQQSVPSSPTGPYSNPVESLWVLRERAVLNDGAPGKLGQSQVAKDFLFFFFLTLVPSWPLHSFPLWIWVTPVIPWRHLRTEEWDLCAGIRSKSLEQASAWVKRIRAVRRETREPANRMCVAGVPGMKSWLSCLFLDVFFLGLWCKFLAWEVTLQ